MQSEEMQILRAILSGKNITSHLNQYPEGKRGEPMRTQRNTILRLSLVVTGIGLAIICLGLLIAIPLLPVIISGVYGSQGFFFPIAFGGMIVFLGARAIRSISQHQVN